MTPAPDDGTPAGTARLAIRRLARNTGGDVQELQTLYVLEALLARLAASPDRDDFVLKGGVLLAAFAVRRPTKDIDLEATRLNNDANEVSTRFREIAILDLPDGVVFDQDSITAAVIRDDDEYAGIRVKLIGRLGTARLTIGVDVNFGDPIWPRPILTALPRLVDLGQPPVQLLGYPLTMVLAEKIITAIDRGVANTRWRDFADIHTLIRVHHVQADELATSLRVVASYRRVQFRPLSVVLQGMPRVAQQKWRAWRSRVHREEELPARFGEVLAAIAAFSDPVLLGNLTRAMWNPRTAKWLENASIE
ncbi:nucleotidyl transferase AbiEii/AbiGii toxin family protein [Citricoccus sp. NPDC055426]|uniref:nucleotidyl transferase AbiEii/AbiGii toxin family protein n=1 Tax=Citricoccus sp. NPDC055426 TaxID=3155536 RepID=UPI003440C9BA